MKILALLPAYNEQGKIGHAVSRIPRGVVSEVLVIDDGSSDESGREAKDAGANVVRNVTRHGVGSVIRQGIAYGRANGFLIIVVMAGNGKDDGNQIPRLTGPIAQGGYDFVQGSRFLKGGAFGRTPLYRIIATRFIHPVLFTLFSGKRITDSTNGFRAIRLAIFDDKRIAIDQGWLDAYELEPYIFFKAITLGYRVREVPVSKIYPPKHVGYTKMRPFVDWWSILRPVFLLGLRIRK